MSRTGEIHPTAASVTRGQAHSGGRSRPGEERPAYPAPRWLSPLPHFGTSASPGYYVERQDHRQPAAQRHRPGR